MKSPQLVKWEKWSDHNEREKQEHGTDGKALDDEMLQEVIGGITKEEERRPEPKKPRKKAGGGSKKTLIVAEGET